MWLFNSSDGSDDKVPYVLKSSQLKVRLLQNLDKDSNHRLSNETVYLDVLHSRYVLIFFNINYIFVIYPEMGGLNGAVEWCWNDERVIWLYREEWIYARMFYFLKATLPYVKVNTLYDLI